MPQSGWYPGGQTRPNLKVQDGCGNRCSFCIIPATRGHSRSLPLQACLQSVRAFADAGGTEMVLSGINLGRWGRDLQPQRMTLDELVQGEILSRTSLPCACVSAPSSPWIGPNNCWRCSAAHRPVAWPVTPICHCNRDPTLFSAPCIAAIVPGTTPRNCA